MKKKLTAAEALELAGPTPEERVDAILIRVEKAARNKQRELRCSEMADSQFWAHAAYNGDKDYLAVKKILTDLGYTVDLYYNAGSQFVDMYTVIRW